MPGHGRNLPAGFGLHGEGVSAAKLALELRALCAEHRVNAICDLPHGVLQRAATIQAEIDRLRSAQREKLAVRGHRGLARAHASQSIRFAARLNAFRGFVATRGGLAAANQCRLARDFGISRTTAIKYIAILRAEQEAGPPRCLACGQLIPPPEVLSVEADIARQETKHTNNAAHRVADQGDQP
jgi:hypothetical protein